MSIVTRANPEEEARLRELLEGRSASIGSFGLGEETGRARRKPARATRKRAKPKPGTPKPVQLVSQYCAAMRGGGVMVQLPMYLSRNQYNASGAYWRKAKTAREHVDTTLLALRAMLRSYGDAERAAIRSVTFVRISPNVLDDDNLPAAFKHVRDATFAWLANGEHEFNRLVIGNFDATVKTGRHTCHYQQQKCEANPRAHGIQIRFGV